MNLETKWLEDFVTLAATRSFSQAADQLAMPRPTVSLAVQQLEAHVLQPIVMGRAVSVHPLAVVLAIVLVGLTLVVVSMVRNQQQAQKQAARRAVEAEKQERSRLQSLVAKVDPLARKAEADEIVTKLKPLVQALLAA